MLGEKVIVLNAVEVRERFPDGILIAEVVDGCAIFCDKKDPLEIFHLADFRSFLGSLSLKKFGIYYYPSGRPYDKFTRQWAKFRQRKLLKLIYRFVYLDKQ